MKAPTVLIMMWGIYNMFEKILLRILFLLTVCMTILDFSEFIMFTVMDAPLWIILLKGLLTIWWGKLAYETNEKIEEITIFEELEDKISFTWADEEEEE